jgi:hypothetical protein
MELQADLSARFGCPVTLTLSVRVLERTSWLRAKERE